MAKIIGELIRAQLQISASDITPTATGLIYFNTTTGVKWHNGTSWFIAADLSSSQTLTNKTLTSPVITTPTGIVKGDVGLGNVDNTSDATKNSATATLTNKTLTSPLFTEVATPATPAAGFVAVYPKADKKLYKLDSTGTETEVGAGSGGSGRNYFSDYFDGTKPVGTVTNGLTATGNRTSGQTTWGASFRDTLLTIANNTTNPLRETGDFKLTNVAAGAGAFVESPMVQLDLADLSKAVTLSFDLTGNSTDDNWDVVVIRYNSSGTYQETISVAGNASTQSPASAKLPTGTTKFNGFFISSNTQTDYYSVRFRRKTGTDSLQIDSLFAGPQSIVTGAIVTDWQSYTPIVSNETGGAITWTAGYPKAMFRRVGQNMEGSYVLNFASFAGSGRVSISYPTGLIRSDAVMAEAFQSGTWSSEDFNGATAVLFQPVRLLGNAFNLLNSGSTDDNLRSEQIVAGKNYKIDISVPISSWTSNTTLAERAVEEFVFSTATTTTAGASDTTSFGYGPQGVQFKAINSTTANSVTAYRCRFTTPIISTSRIDLEFSRDQINWIPLGSDGVVMRLGVQGLSNYGMTMTRVSGSTTDVDVYFGNNGRISTNAAYAGNGAAWSDIAGAAYYWRLRKTDGGASVGYPIGAANILVNHNSTVTSDTIKSGTYTPTISGAVNCSVTAQVCNYTQVGSIVTVTGYALVDVVAAGGAEYFITLPIASNFTSTNNGQGTCVHAQVGGAYDAGRCNADSATDKIQINWRASGVDLAAREQSFVFSYVVI